jgi:thiamine biosynthesis lipoprotein
MRGLEKAAVLVGLLMAGDPEATGAQEVGESAPGVVRVQREAYLMGTRLRVEVLAPSRPVGIGVIEEVFQVVGEVEGILSDFRSDAELARVNAAEAGKRTALSDDLARMLSEAFAWSERTGGAFDPVAGSLVAEWDLRGAGRVPTRAELERARQSASAGAVEFDFASRTILRKSAEVALDPGGFGKGEALRAAALRLRELGIESASMDFGGQVYVLGDGPSGHGAAWPTVVSHPLDRSLRVGALSLRDVSASTSGPSEKGVRIDGQPFSHHIDPRTGHPVRAWGSVTVVAADPFVADVLSTALYVMGPRYGMIWAQDQDDVGVLFLTTTPQGAVRSSMNAAMERWWVAASFAGRLDER